MLEVTGNWFYFCCRSHLTWYLHSVSTASKGTSAESWTRGTTERLLLLPQPTSRIYITVPAGTPHPPPISSQMLILSCCRLILFGFRWSTRFSSHCICSKLSKNTFRSQITQETKGNSVSSSCICKSQHPSLSFF